MERLLPSGEKLYFGKTANEWLIATRTFFNSGYAFILQAVLAFIFVFLQQEVIGVIVFIGLLLVYLIQESFGFIAVLFEEFMFRVSF